MRILLLVSLLSITAFAVTVTPGTEPARSVTASTSTGLDTITITAQPAAEQQFAVGQVLQVQGITPLLIVTALAQTGNPATTSTVLTVAEDDWSAFAAAGDASGLTVRIIADGLDHTSFRVWSTTDTAACLAVWYDTSSHVTATDYQYRSNETSCSMTVQAADVIGLEPGTRWHFRINAKAAYGTDNSGACNSDGCGAVDLAITTPADTHDALGKPPMPTLPEAVASWVTDEPDTTGYTTVSVPEFADGVVTGSINHNSSTLTVNTVPAGMSNSGNQWIMIAGGGCEYNAPWCRISGISGTTVTLASNWVSDTASNATGAAVSWSLFTIQYRLQQHVDGYGTIYSFAQGYRGAWYDTDYLLGNDALVIPGLAVDGGASSIDDPTHKWIILETVASPSNLPPAGVRTGPEYAAALGGMTGHGSSPSIRISGGGEDSMSAHHIRIRNLAFVGTASGSTDADPSRIGGGVTLDHGEYMPQYIAIDRIYVDSPDVNTRSIAVSVGGKNIAIENSYIRTEGWRPYIYNIGPSAGTWADITASTNELSIPGIQWQRRSTQSLVTQGSATVTASGTASADVTVIGVMEAAAGNGVEVLYSSGKGITLACPSCRAVTAVATPSVTATQKKFFSATISSGSGDFSGLAETAEVVEFTEGPEAFIVTDGDHMLFENNYIEAYNKGIFIDVPTASIIAPPHDITIRRNAFEWKDPYRATSGTSNGFNYAVRHCAFEAKRGTKILFEDNTVTGCWAGINAGGAFVLSNTATENPIQGVTEDVTVRYNRFYNFAEAVSVNSHYVGNNPQMGIDSRRIYYGHNLSINQNGWRQHTYPGVTTYGRQVQICGHDNIIQHNTFFDAYGNFVVLNACGEDRSEGLWMTDNIQYTNVGNYGLYHIQRENSGLAPIPDTTQTTAWIAGNFDTAWNSVSFRVNGTALTANYAIQRNTFICGNSQVSDLATGQLLDHEVEYTASECSTQKGRWGSLQSLNYWNVAHNTKAERTADALWADTSAWDLRWKAGSPHLGAQKTTDGLDMGVNVNDLNEHLGTISNMNALDIRAVGVRSCTGAGGTYCTTLIAVVPDGGASCYASYGAHSSAETGWTVTAANTATTPQRTFSITGLAAGSYDWRIKCAGGPPSSTEEFTVP